ncbi:hypothetical protein ANO11243_027110 [Dothideomycetidae sp. 11243]|nr:hypothetical protein ANO11243_027110 [fungal sp. No.11243]
MTTASSVNGAEHWTAIDHTVFTDANNNFLIYYPDTVDLYGVSRFRSAAWGSIPLTANLITLSTVTGANGTSALLAVDTQGDYFFPILCLFDDLSNKLFLVKNPTTDLQFVADQSLRYVVTGGVVTECDPLALNMIPTVTK